MHSTNRRVIDLSHPITDGLVTYPGLPAPAITDHLTRAEAEEAYGPGVTFHIGRIDMVANTGTYLDAPAHRYARGADLADLAVARLVDVPGIAIDCRAAGRSIGVEHLPADGFDGCAVLLRTGWSRYFATPAYATDAPFLTAAGAQHLVDGGAMLVGIDSLNIDDTEDPHDRTRPAHSILLAAGVPILEHLTKLEELPASDFSLTALPPAIVGMGTFPVRAVAIAPS